MYKKYITKKGKRIGPYYYSSIRLSNGRVRSVYLGSDFGKAGEKEKRLQKEQIKSVHKRSSATVKKALKKRIFSLGHPMHTKFDVSKETSFKDRILLFFVLVAILLSFSHFTGLLADDENGMGVGHVIKDKYSDFSKGFLGGESEITGQVIMGTDLVSNECEYDVGVILNKSSELYFKVNGAEKLVGLMLDGRIARNPELRGETKIFLTDDSSGETYIVYDGEVIEEEGSFTGITGRVVEALTNEVEEIVEEEKIAYDELYDLGVITGFDIIDNNGNDVYYELVEEESGIYGLEINELYVSGLKVNDNGMTGWVAYQEYPARGLIEPENISFEKIFAFDTNGIDVSNESNVLLKGKSENSYLYKCDYWDFEVGICLTDWIYLFDIVSNEGYVADLSQNIVAFAEGIFDDTEEEIIEEVFEGEIIGENVTEEVDIFVNFAESLKFDDIIEFEEECGDTCHIKDVLGNSFTIKVYVKNNLLEINNLKIVMQSSDELPCDIGLTNSLGEDLVVRDEVEEFSPDVVDGVVVENKATADYVEETVQYDVVINQPVKWKKKLAFNTIGNVVDVEIPIEAENITVRQVNETILVEELAVEEGLFEGAAEVVVEEGVGILENLITGNLITGLVVAVENGLTNDVEEVVAEEGISVVGVVEEEKVMEISLELEDEVEEIEVEYETPGPVTFEKPLDDENGKRIVVSSEIHYENILAYTEVGDVPKESIKLYRLVNGTRESASIINYVDSNNNSKIDMIYWVVPHLSNQTYDVILIIKAEHLDENRVFISDIFDEVKDLDDVWSEKIYHNEYVRVTFEYNLSSSRDITIYPRNTQGKDTIVEVYYAGTDNKIMEFPVINEEKYYKEYLTNMVGENDTFDLRIKNLDSESNAYLEFDHIIDPDSPLGIIVLGPANNTNFVSIGNIILNTTIMGAGNLQVEIFGTNGSKGDTLNREKLIYCNLSLVNGTNIHKNWTFPTIEDDGTGLVIYHFDNRSEFDENDSKSYDFTDGKYNLSIDTSSGVDFAPNANGEGVNAGAIKFNFTGGKAEVVGCGYDCYNQTNRTYLIWLKDYSNTGSRVIFGAYAATPSNRGFLVTRTGSGSPGTLSIFVNSGVTPSITAANFFYQEVVVHLGIVMYGNGSMIIYKDGEVFETGTINAPNSAEPNDFNLGALQASAYRWLGAMDDLGIYNRDFSAEEVKNAYRLKNGTYYWYANVSNSTGDSVVSAIRTFTIGQDYNITDCIEIDSPGTYEIGTNISTADSDHCINITSDNVELDCKGHEIKNTVAIPSSSSPYTGIYAYRNVQRNTNITLNNCTIKGWREQIKFLNASNNTIKNMFFDENSNQIGSMGILLQNSESNIIDNISIRSMSDVGIQVDESDRNIFNLLNISDSDFGFEFIDSNHTILTNSTIHNGSQWDVRFSPTGKAIYCGNYFENIIGTGGNPILHYNKSITLEDWNSNFSEIILCNADYSSLDNMTLNNAGNDDGNNGIFFINVDNSNFTNSYFNYTHCGVISMFSTHNRISNNTFENLGRLGVELHKSNYTVLTNLSIRHAGAVGVLFKNDSSQNNLTTSTIFNISSAGIRLFLGGAIAPNLIYNNFFNSSTNMDTSGATIYANSWNVTTQAGIREYSAGTNIGGNFWAEPDGSGYSENCDDTNDDGFCDVAYNMTTDSACSIGVNCSINVDYLPYSEGYVGDVIKPTIAWITPTPGLGSTVTINSVYLNTTVTDASNTSAFFDWNYTLLGYWSFEEYNTSGIYDNSSYGHFGKFKFGSSTSNITTGKYGDGFYFNGKSNHILTGVNNYSDELSFDYWFQSSYNGEDFTGHGFRSNATNEPRIMLRHNRNNTGPASGYYNVILEGDSGNVLDGEVNIGSELYDGNWHHIIVNFKQSADLIEIYFDSVKKTVTYKNQETPSLTTGYAYEFAWGAVQKPMMIYNSDNHFNGTLDEARIHKRILGSAEINASFNNNANRLYNNFTGLSNAVYNYSAWMVDLSGNVNKSITRGVTVSVSGGTPTNPSTGINSTARSNTTLSDLNCYATINDPNSDKMNVSVRWWKDAVGGGSWVINLSLDFNNSYNSGIFFTTDLDSLNTTSENIWKCSLRLHDGSSYSAWSNSSGLTIQNTQPGAPDLLLPADKYVTTDRTPTFVWKPKNMYSIGGQNSSDPDFNAVAYFVNRTCMGGCADDSAAEKVDENIANCDSNGNGYLDTGDNCTYTLTTPLRYFGDDNYYYNWTVRQSGNATGDRNLNISAYVGLTFVLDRDTINFGTMNPDTSNDTTDCSLSGIPSTDPPCPPMHIRNSGNTNISFNISGPQGFSFWETANISISDEFFAFKIGNGTSGISYNSSGTNNSFIKLPRLEETWKIVDDWGWSGDEGDLPDNLRFDVYLNVPVGETVGDKGVKLDLLGWYENG